MPLKAFERSNLIAHAHLIEDADAVAEHEMKLKLWKKLDAAAQKIIVTTVAEQTLVYIISCVSFREMWQEINSIFENRSETAKHVLQQQWYAAAKDSEEDISTCISRIRYLAHHLSMLGNVVPNGMVVTKILMTLPPAYAHFNTAWNSTAPDQRTPENLTARSTGEELRIGVSDAKGNRIFFTTQRLVSGKECKQS